MITEEELQKEINHLKDCENQLIKIRSLLANYDFSPGVSELSVAKPEGIYHMVEELEKWNREKEKALREIDTHIRSTAEPTPHIIETLKKSLPEY